jgi:hypothetical protein
MKKTLAVLALAAVALTTAPRADARTTQTYRYVATESGSDLYSLVSDHNTPAGRVSPSGGAAIRATGRSLTVLVDDVAVLTGAPISVWVSDAGWVCLPDSRPREFPTQPGSTYYVILHDHLYPQCGGIASGATAGTMTLVA